MQPSSSAVDDSIPTNDEYGAWTDPTFVPEQKLNKKKTGAMRWLDPDWSVVRWVRDWFSDDDDEDLDYKHALEHDHMHTNG